jgi:hypothetical protein
MSKFQSCPFTAFIHAESHFVVDFLYFAIGMKQRISHFTYRMNHPKKRYETAKEAAKELKAIEKHNRETQNNFSNSRSKLMVYYNGDLKCFQIGHCRNYRCL